MSSADSVWCRSHECAPFFSYGEVALSDKKEKELYSAKRVGEVGLSASHLFLLNKKVNSRGDSRDARRLSADHGRCVFIKRFHFDHATKLTTHIMMLRIQNGMIQDLSDVVTF